MKNVLLRHQNQLFHKLYRRTVADKFRLQWVKLNQFHHRMLLLLQLRVCAWLISLLFLVAIAFSIAALHISTHANTAYAHTHTHTLVFNNSHYLATQNKTYSFFSFFSSFFYNLLCWEQNNHSIKLTYCCCCWDFRFSEPLHSGVLMIKICGKYKNKYILCEHVFSSVIFKMLFLLLLFLAVVWWCCCCC